MNIAFRTAALGVQAYQRNMDILANNMANVSNFGYKRLRGAFTDLLYSNMTHYAEQGGEDLRTGHGVRVNATDYLFEQGNPMSTDRDLDFCIIGDGFFGVISPLDGSIKYTRDGNFSYSLEEDGMYLVTGGGNYLIDQNGEKVKVSMTEHNELDVDKLLKDLGVFEFDNPYAMDPDGMNLLSSNVLTGPAKPAVNSEVRQGMIENSSVDMAKEMTEVMINQRAFQFNARVVQIADELEQEVNKLR